MSHPYESFMREAAELAERGRWSAAPNPTVGAVLVRDGVVVARGWHTAYGKSHAEVECLKDAEAKGVAPSACTLVVTLEPCNHQGQTPPCTEAVIAAGIPTLMMAQEGKDLVVTPRELDSVIAHGAALLGAAINRALQPRLSIAQLCWLVG